MRRFIILDTFDIQKLTNNEMLRLPADEIVNGDGCDIIILSETAYIEYLKSRPDGDS